MKKNVTKNEKKFFNQLVTSGDNSIGLFETVKFAVEMNLLGEKPEHSDTHWFAFRTHFMKLVANYEINNYGRDRYDYHCKFNYVMTNKLLEFFDECVEADYECIESFVNGYIETNQKKFGGYDYENYKYDFGYDDYMFELTENITNAISESIGTNSFDFQWGITNFSKAKSPSKSKPKNNK